MTKTSEEQEATKMLKFYLLPAQKNIATVVNTSLFTHLTPPLFSLRPPVASCRCGRLVGGSWVVGEERGDTLCGYFHLMLNLPFFPFFPSDFWALCHPSLLPVAPLLETTKSKFVVSSG